MTYKCPGLYYLDEKPIFEEDRMLIEAFMEGGKDQEQRVKLELEDKKRQANNLSK